MSNPILVRKIVNLTDARYYAAMGVDWISMELTEDPLSFSRWHTVREWISGVKLAAELKTDDESLIAKAIIDANPDGIVFDDLTFTHLTGGIYLFILTEKLMPRNAGQLFAQVIPFDPLNFHADLFSPVTEGMIYLEGDWTPELILKLKDEGYTGGVCFEGGDESILGMRDYVHMDEMIELLRS